MVTTHARGRRPIGISQQPGQGGDNYPLVQPSDDVDRLLADAWLAFVDNTNTFELPFRINWLYGFGTNSVSVPITPAFSHDIEIVDANDEVVFSSLASGVEFESWDWDGRLKILQWVDGENICRVVYHTAWSPEDAPITYDEYIEPTSAVLSSRVVWQYPRRVNAFVVGLTTVQADTVEFQNGYNTELLTETPDLADGARRTTVVGMTAIPGGGSVGRFGPGCEEGVDPAIRRVNSIGPNARGNFTLDASGCYRVQRPIQSVLTAGDIRDVQVRNHAVQVANDCGPCCDCDDFINVWEALRKLRNRYSDLVSTAQAVRDQYHANRQRWLDSAECRDNRKLRIAVAPICPGELGVAVGYCNNSPDCLVGLVIHMSFQYTDMRDDPCTRNQVTGEQGSNKDTPITAVTTATFDELVCQSTFRAGNVDPDTVKGNSGGASKVAREFYKLGGGWPHYWAQWDAVEPGGMASVTFRLKFSDIVSSDRIELVAEAFGLGGFSPIVGGTPVPGYTLGEGPLTTDPSVILTTCPQFISTSIPEEPCCESSV